MADSGFQADPNANPTDPAYVAKFVQYLASQPGADPTLASDPNYWIGKITETGGVTSSVAGKAPGEGDNIGYWTGRSKQGAGDTGGGGGGQGGAGGFQYSPSQFVSGPFGQYALKEAQNAVNSNLFSKGLGLSTGAGKDLANATYGALGQLIPQDYAMQSGQFQQNFGNLNTLAGYGMNATNAAAGYNTGAAAAGAAGTVGSANAINQGINNVGSTLGNYALYKSVNPSGATANKVNYANNATALNTGGSF